MLSVDQTRFLALHWLLEPVAIAVAVESRAMHDDVITAAMIIMILTPLSPSHNRG